MNLEQFENKLKDWGFGYPEWAGCRLIQDENARVKDDVVYAESDCIMVDERCFEGTFGISHEEPTVIYTIELKKPKKFGVDYKLKQKKRAITTYELIERYFWMSDLFTDWEHVKTAGVKNYNDWENAEDITQCFETEITQLQDDPWLAMYWLLHMGLTCDNRYEIIKAKTLELNLAEQLPDITDCIAWFDVHDAFYNMKVNRRHPSFSNSTPSLDANDLFLIRRADLLFSAHTYNLGQKDGFDKWWLSIKIYPKAEEMMIRRMRWLWRNLDEFNQWDAFDKQLKNENPNEIALLSYVLALNPKEENKTKYADKFIAELNEYKTFWTDKTAKAFAKAMIFHLKDWYSDKEILKKVMQYYFIGDSKNEDYKTLQKQYFNDETISVDVSKELEKLGSFFEEDLMFIDAEDEEDLADFNPRMKKAKIFLATLNDAQISALVTLAMESAYELETPIYVLIEYLFENDIKDRKELLLQLFSEQGCFQFNVFEEFLKPLIKDENDPNIAIIQELIEKTQSDWTSTLSYAFTNTKILTFESVFEWYISLFSKISETDDMPTKVISFIRNAMKTVRNEKGRSVWVYSYENLNKSQVERLFETIFDNLLRLHKEGKWEHDVLYCISYVAKNPLGKEWVENFLKDYATYESNFNKKSNFNKDIADYLKTELRLSCSALNIEDKALTKQLEKR